MVERLDQSTLGQLQAHAHDGSGSNDVSEGSGTAEVGEVGWVVPIHQLVSDLTHTVVGGVGKHTQTPWPKRADRAS